MTDTTPPIEAQRYGRSQTPESPRPVHIPEPSNIPVLRNQMDPVFNDTATYNIPNDQNFSPYSNRDVNQASQDEHDAVQNFLRGAEAESSFAQKPFSYPLVPDGDVANPLVAQPALMSDPVVPSSSNQNVAAPPADSSNALHALHSNLVPVPSADPEASFAQVEDTSVQPNVGSGNAAATIGASQAVQGQSEGGVDYSSLLASITRSVSTAPAIEPITAPTTAAPGTDQTTHSLSSVPGLPPKPPAQQLPPEAAGLLDQNDASTTLTIQTGNPFQRASNGDSDQATAEPSSSQQGNHDVSSAIPLDESAYNPNAYPPHIDTSAPAEYANQMSEVNSATERPWTPGTQRVYDQFLDDERRYVTEGIWDKFPLGSRLFVGNLPSEKVTKRDLFHIFHRYGRLAQISIKQAYGFVQFLEAADCADALQAEQSVEIRGRKVHLEVSKPQKNTRGAGASGNKQAARRRSRSPDRRASADRFGGRPPFSDFRDEPSRRREEFRGSNSPRPYRSRDDFRPPQPTSRDFMPQNGRPHSPAYAAFPPQGFPPQPYDEDAILPLQRRNPQDVPDVQILILDNSVAQSFINWVENAFRAKGLRAATIWLSARLPLQAVVKRQILEGVQAVVKLIQQNQFKNKVPLQVFDRSAGVSNVNFNEYVDLEVQVAADIVVHARQKERGQMFQSPQSAYPPTPTYGQPPPHQVPQHYGQPPMPQAPPQPWRQPSIPQYQQQRPPQAPLGPYAYPPQHQYQHHLPQQSPATPSSAGSANLQQLLANLSQPGSAGPQHHTPTSATGHANIGGLLNNIAAQQQNNQPAYNPNSQQQYQPQPQQQGYGGGQQQNNVQDIMQQLARYQR